MHLTLEGDKRVGRLFGVDVGIYSPHFDVQVYDPTGMLCEFEHVPAIACIASCDMLRALGGSVGRLCSLAGDLGGALHVDHQI
jgi:hypothetical protein